MKRIFILLVVALNMVFSYAQTGLQQNEARKTFDKVI